MAGPHRRSVEPEFSRLNAPWTLNRTGVPNTPGLVSIAPSVSMPSRRVISVRPPSGVLLYLVSVGFVGAVIVGLFFGSAFLLLGQPIGQIQTVSGTNDRDTVVDLQAAFTRAFDQGNFAEQIDYRKDPATRLGDHNRRWLDAWPRFWFWMAPASATSPARRSAAAALSSPFPDPAATVGATTAPAIQSTP